MAKGAQDDGRPRRRRRQGGRGGGGGREGGGRDGGGQRGGGYGGRERDPGRDERRGVYMISVAAELAGMHPQTLRIYEQRGLIRPQRSPGRTRLYSDEDVQRLRRIQQLTTELGMNLAGVERVFELEDEIGRMRARMDRLERDAERVREELEAEIERVRRSFRAELVPYRAPGRDLVPVRHAGRRGVRIPIERREGR